MTQPVPPFMLGQGALPPGIGDAGSSQALAAAQAPAAASAAPAPTFSPATIDALYQAGHLTPEQYASMGGNPVAPAPAQPAEGPGLLARAGHWLAEANRSAGNAILGANQRAGQAVVDTINGPAPTPAAAPAATPPKNLVVAGQGGGSPTGVAEGQGAPPDPLAGLLGLRGGGAPAHRVGLSPADEQYQASLRDQAQVAVTNAQAQQEQLTNLAKQSADASNTLATQSQQGLLDYQQHVQQNDAHRQQVEADSRSAQDRIQKQIADLSAQGIDPNRYFQNQSTGQNILGGILVGLGAFGAHGLGPGGHDSTNTALEIMNGAIARDVDAQKSNLQKSLSVLGSRMNLNAQSFDQQKALLESERESLQSGYAVASNEVAKRAAMFKDNADMQLNATKMNAGLEQALAERVAPINQQLYSINKAGERVVGGPGTADIAKAIRERTKEIRDKGADHGKDISPEEAHRQALQEYAGVDVGGGRPNESFAAAPKKSPDEQKAAEAAARAASVESLAGRQTSTNWSPISRNIQGTDNFAAESNHERWNAAIMGMVHQKYAARSPEAMKEIGSAYLINSGDSSSTIKRKTAAALDDLVHMPDTPAAGNPAGLDEQKEPD